MNGILREYRPFGLDLLDGSLEDAVSAVLAFDGQDPAPFEPLVFTPNLDILVRLETLRTRDPGFVARLGRSMLVLPDGFPVVMAARMLGAPVRERVAGSDLGEALPAACTGSRFLAVVPDEETGVRMAERMARETDHALSWIAPPVIQPGSPEFNEYADRIASMIETTSPRFVLVCIGFPKQERLAFAVIDRIRLRKMERMPLFFGIGAAARFYAGTVKRAPGWMQRNGLEWVHRLLKEPRRMAGRYLWDALAFGPLLWREWRRKRTYSGDGSGMPD